MINIARLQGVYDALNGWDGTAHVSVNPGGFYWNELVTVSGSANRNWSIAGKQLAIFWVIKKAFPKCSQSLLMPHSQL